MMNQTYVFETPVVESTQRIARIAIHNLRGIPIPPPPFRDRPKTEGALLLEMETSDGIVGYATSGYAHHSVVELVERWIAPRLIEAKADPFRTDHVATLFDRHTWERALGRTLTAALSMVDIACWDIKGKALGKPVHHLLGGARDRVPVYVTHGAAYEGAPVYSREELAAEAAHLVGLGCTHLKNTVGRQQIPDPADDYQRMAAMREAVGPDVQLSMDGNLRMNLPQAMKLCQMCEELDIAFIEEPIHYNDPRNLHHLRLKTTIPVAAAENDRFSTLQLLQADAVDYLQPNVNNDGGYTAAVRNAAIARAFNVPLSHGNGNGPHNIALHAGLQHGGLVEYHFHKWMAYNAIFKTVPQPENGWLTVSQEPGLGLDPKDGLIAEFAVRS
jgi:L-alanine-DL-glutamate epimerase-like enolase superfamily enzyme